jgi:hypothetical protein
MTVSLNFARQQPSPFSRHLDEPEDAEAGDEFAGSEIWMSDIPSDGFNMRLLRKPVETNFMAVAPVAQLDRAPAF